jgi:CheY-like chemotaxis protein
MANSILIHNDNSFSIDSIFKDAIKFEPRFSDIDICIQEDIILELINKNYDVIFIKDNLSQNYLELLGLRVAYHIRFSTDLGKKQYLPIVILTDLDGYLLSKLQPVANILFTKNVFIIPNTKEAIKNISKKQFKPLSEIEYKNEFLEKIKVEQPRDTTGNHDIANKWSIYRWAEFLDAKSDVINKNRNEIENQLYFKYLKALHTKNKCDTKEIKKPSQKGKVLLIDDEWDKGWKDIIKNIVVDLEVFEYDFKDSNFGLLGHISKKVIEVNPDVVILDLRLSQKDQENDDIEKYTGIKVLQKIHEINAGIQVIMLTATSKSTILEKLYEKKILGYVKKEHLEDKNIDTVENINKFIRLVDKGLERKYLKKIWDIQQEILSLNILKTDNKNYKKIYFEISNTFDILDSNLDKKTTFFILAIYNIIELIVKEYGYKEGSTYKHIINICHSLNLTNFDDDLSRMICTRNYLIHLDDNIKEICIGKTVKEPNQIHLVTWVEILKNILVAIDKK